MPLSGAPFAIVFAKPDAAGEVFAALPTLLDQVKHLIERRDGKTIELLLLLGAAHGRFEGDQPVNSLKPSILTLYKRHCCNEHLCRLVPPLPNAT